jgi:hypothetical protein
MNIGNPSHKSNIFYALRNKGCSVPSNAKIEIGLLDASDRVRTFAGLSGRELGKRMIPLTRKIT